MVNKDDLAKAAGLQVYDTALPQDWLNGVVERIVGMSSDPIPNTRLHVYQTILSGTVWCYDTPRSWGAPVALTDEANRLLSLLD